MAEAGDEHLGLDASDLISEVQKLSGVFNNFNKTLQTVRDNLGDVSNNMGTVMVRYRDMDAEGNKLNATLRATADGWKVVSSSISLASDNFRQLGLIHQSVTERMIRNADATAAANRRAFISDPENQRIADRQRISLVTPGRTASVSGEGVGAAGTLGGTQAQLEADFAKRQASSAAAVEAANARIKASQDSLISDVRVVEQQLLREAAAFNATEKAATAFAASLNQVNAQQQAQATQAVRQAQQQQANRLLTTQLQRQFVLPSIASDAEVTRVTTSIGKVVTAAQAGGVGIQRAFQIVNSVARNTGEVFVGAENRVAGAASTLVTSSSKMGSSVDSANAKIARSNERTRTSFTETGRAGQEAGRFIGLTWEGLGRIFLVQSLHTVIGRFLQALGQAVTTTAEFQIRISEIRTISQGNQQTFSEWAASVRALSDQFGNPILETAKGLYEAISNQVAKGAESALFMQKALTFAQVAVATTAESVNLLSSAMNAYKLGVESADRISAILFKTIDLGRVTASQLANVFGNVTALSAPLGISLEEVGAAIATITIRGVEPHTALTLLANVMRSLLSPSKELKVFLRDIGFESGQAAIASIGFAGVLRKIEEATKGDLSELSELFPEMRALRAAASLTGSALDGFESNLKSIKGSTEGWTNAIQIAQESAGRTFTIELNRIKNFFVADFGQPFINFIASIGRESDASGQRLHGFADVVRDIITTAKSSIEIFAAYRAILLAVTVAENAQRIALIAQDVGYKSVTASGVLYARTLLTLKAIGTALTSPVAIATAIIGAGILYYNRLQEKAAEAAEQFTTLETRITESVEKNTRQRVATLNAESDQIKSAINDRFNVYTDRAGKIGRAADAIAKAEVEAAKAVGKAVKTAFDVNIANIREGINKLEKQSAAAAENISRAAERITAIREDRSRSAFESRIKLLPEPQQVQATFAEIDKLQRASLQKLSGAGKDALTDQKTLASALKDQDASDKLTLDLTEKRNAAETKRKELVKERTELEAKSVSGHAISEERIGLTKLEQEASRTHGKRKSQLDEEIRQRSLQIRLMQQQATEEGQGRRGEELDKEIAGLDALLKSLGSTADFEKLITDNKKQQVDFLLQYEKAEKAIQDAAEKRAKAESDRLEKLKDTLELLNEFKLTDKGKEITDPAKAKDRIDEFNKLIQTGRQQGISEDALQAALQKRVQLEKEATIEIERHRLAEFNNTVLRQKEAITAASQAITNIQIKGETTREAGFQRIEALGQALKTFEDSFVGLRLFKGSEVRDLGQTLTVAKQAPTKENIQELLNKSNALVTALSDASQAFKFGQFAATHGLPGANTANLGDISKIFVVPPEKDLTGQPIPKTGQTLGDIQGLLIKSIGDISRTLKDEQEAKKNQADLQAQLGLILKTAPDAATTMKTASEQYQEAITNTVKNLKDFDTALDKITGKFNALGLGQVPQKAQGSWSPFAPRGTDNILAMVSAGEFVMNAKSTQRYLPYLRAMNSGYFADGGIVTKGNGIDVNGLIANGLFSTGLEQNNTSVGDIHIHVPVNEVDALAIAKQIQNEIRLNRIDFTSKRG